MINHPAMPCICNDMDEPEAAADEVFRSMVKWLEEHNMNTHPSLNLLVLTQEDWQSLREAARVEAKNE